MKKSQIFIYCFGASVLTALLAVVFLFSMIKGSTMSHGDSRANPAFARSYEDVVKAEQQRWGHGHTAGDSSTADPGFSGLADHTPRAGYAIPK